MGRWRSLLLGRGADGIFLPVGRCTNPSPITAAASPAPTPTSAPPTRRPCSTGWPQWRPPANGPGTAPPARARPPLPWPAPIPASTTGWRRRRAPGWRRTASIWSRSPRPCTGLSGPASSRRWSGYCAPAACWPSGATASLTWRARRPTASCSTFTPTSLVRTGQPKRRWWRTATATWCCSLRTCLLRPSPWKPLGPWSNCLGTAPAGRPAPATAPPWAATPSTNCVLAAAWGERDSPRRLNWPLTIKASRLGSA
jgi:hypothetical protein